MVNLMVIANKDIGDVALIYLSKAMQARTLQSLECLGLAETGMTEAAAMELAVALGQRDCCPLLRHIILSADFGSPAQAAVDAAVDAGGRGQRLQIMYR